MGRPQVNIVLVLVCLRTGILTDVSVMQILAGTDRGWAPRTMCTSYMKQLATGT